MGGCRAACTQYLVASQRLAGLAGFVSSCGGGLAISTPAVVLNFATTAPCKLSWNRWPTMMALELAALCCSSRQV